MLTFSAGPANGEIAKNATIPMINAFPPTNRRADNRAQRCEIAESIDENPETWKLAEGNERVLRQDADLTQASRLGIESKKNFIQSLTGLQRKMCGSYDFFAKCHWGR
ncbi:MAG: hypothetical protein K8T89_14720 [Planctomycetes bacterium]|nr:hypothetical protein [Planctomycetota bacterium]